MNVRPLHDRIIVQRIEEGEQKVGGIIIPDTAKEKPQQGKVIAAGNGKVERTTASASRSTSRPAT
jgi:chaperonin GroES